ncbi:MAG TPA: SDR family oxidoreductase [Candidatus Binataceae bacterium]|nr:SDR family oxidoreductase [Candidatus Binataceae bacterium]
MDYFITGGNGLLGSHLIARLLTINSVDRIACLVRGDTQEAAEVRLAHALELAIDDAGLSMTAHNLMGRILVVQGDLYSIEWTRRRELQGWLRSSGPLHIVHSAANISFSENERTSIWRTNVEGTTQMLAVASRLPNVASFNYVSTAYVAGKRYGIILEADQPKAPEFNNSYEESKWTAEGLVREHCSAHAIPFRIFRPSIIIGDSGTHRISIHTGFYNVIEKVWHLTRLAKPSDFPIHLPFDPAATLDLIPVDIVVREMLLLLGGGEATYGKTFHLTNEEPLTLPDIIYSLSMLTGVKISYTQPAEPAASGLGALIGRGIRHYAPYLRQIRHFDRSNVRLYGADRPQRNYRLDTEELKRFAAAFMEFKLAQPKQMTA